MRNGRIFPVALLAASAALCAACGAPTPWKDRRSLEELQEDRPGNAPEGRGDPEVFALLPEGNRAGGAPTFLPGGPEGLPSLADAHAAAYEGPDGVYEGFVCAYPDADEARGGFEALASSLDREVRERDRFSAEDGTDRRVAILLRGRFVAGVRGAPAESEEAFLEAVEGAIEAREEE
jgi:hypothetical protein